MKVAVVSQKFSPGHIAHLRAYKELFSATTEKVELFLTPEYEKFMEVVDGIVYTDDIQRVVDSHPDLVFIYNISISNISLAKKCNKARIKTVYVLHEPRCSMKELMAEGKNIFKMIGANIINGLICRIVDKVLLASETGRKNYNKYMRASNRNYDVFPLIFLDEYDLDNQYSRDYFSYIGGFTDVHACGEFLRFMEYGLSKTEDMKFLIATRMNVSRYLKNDVFKNSIANGRLLVQDGRPMTTEEINGFYRQSICVWNAYNRSTQSGVLPNALMQGAPVIVNENGAAKEIMDDRTVGCFIDMPPDNKQIMDCYRYVEEHLEEMEQNARKLFLNKYYYKSCFDLAKEVILS